MKIVSSARKLVRMWAYNLSRCLSNEISQLTGKPLPRDLLKAKHVKEEVKRVETIIGCETGLT